MGLLSTIKNFITNHKIIALFLLCFIIFNMNFKVIGLGDTVYATLLPFNILDNHTFYMDSYVSEYNTVAPAMSQGGVPYFLTKAGDHFVGTTR